MKIHLPVGLRKALLACLRSVPLHHKLSRTVSTGTVLLGIASLFLSGGLRADAAPLNEDKPGISEEELLPSFEVIAAGSYTWTSPAANGTFTWGENSDWGGGVTGYTDGSAVTFSGQGGTITLAKDVETSTLNIGGDGTPTFTITSGTGQKYSVTASGAVTVKTGNTLHLNNVNFTANAGYSGTGSTLALENGSTLTLSGTSSTNSLGTVTLADGTSVSLSDSSAAHYTGTTIGGGAGSVVFNFGSEVTIGADNHLFAALFAGGTNGSMRDTTYTGVGEVQLESGTHLIIAEAGENKEIGKELSLAQKLVVNTGSSITLQANIFDNGSNGGAPGAPKGTLVLSGNGGGNAQGALKLDTGDAWIKWDITLADNATIYNNRHNFYFTGGGTLDLAEHRLTLSGPSGSQYHVGEQGGTNYYVAGSAGTIALSEGVTLNMYPSQQGATFGRVNVELAAESNLTIHKEVTLNSVSGAGNLKVEAASLTLAGSLALTGDVSIKENASLVYNGSEALSAGTITLTGGTLKVLSGGLKVQEGISGTLTAPTFGTGDKGIVLNIATENLTLGGEITLNGENTLTFATPGDQMLVFESGATYAGDGSLHITIDEAITENYKSGEVQIVDWGDGYEAWKRYIAIDDPNTEDSYANFFVDSDGNICWEDVGKELHWPGSGGSDAPLTLGEGQWSDKKDGLLNHEWDSERVVYLDATTGSYTVNVKGNAVSMAGLVLAEGTAEYTLSDAQPKTVTVDGALTNGAKLTVEDNITLILNGDYTGSGVVKLAGGTVTVGHEKSLNGAKLELAGGELNAAAKFTADGKTADVNAEVTVSGGDTTLSGVTLSGTVKGEEGVKLTVAAGKLAGLSGDISGYSGTLNTEAGGTWKLSGSALTGTVGVTVDGGGTIQFDGVAMYGGKVEGGVTLEGLSGLTIVSVDTSAGAKLKGNITLGNASTQAKWSGTEVLSGTVTLANVELLTEGGITKRDGVSVVVNTSQGGIVNVKGMDAVNLDGITINEHGQLTGVTGSYTAGNGKKLELHFAEENVSGTSGEGQALIEGGQGDFTLNASSKGDVTLDMDDALFSIVELLRVNDEAGGEAYVHLLKGGTLTMEGLTLSDLKGAEVLGVIVDDLKVMVEGGCIKITGSTADVYLALGGETVDAAVPEGMKAVAIGAGKSVTFTTTQGATLHNLLGESGSALTLRKKGTGGDVTFTLENAYTDPEDIKNFEKYPEVEQTTVSGLDTKFLGSIHGEAGVNIAKDGAGTLTIGGSYTLDGGGTTLMKGRLELQGTGNKMGWLNFAYSNDPTPENTETQQHAEERGLVLANGETTIGTISDAGNGAEGNTVYFRNKAKLTLQGASTLTNTDFIGEDGSGTLVLEGNGSLALGSGELRDIAVQLNGEKTMLDIGSGKSSVTTLSGNGVLRSQVGAELSVNRDSTFSGTLSSSEEGGAAGNLVVKKGANFTLDNVETEADAKNPSQGWGIKVEDGVGLTIDVRKKHLGKQLVFGDIDLGSGNTTHILINSDTYNGSSQNTITGNTLTFGEGTSIVLEAVEGEEDWSPYKELTLGKYNEVNGLTDITDEELRKQLDVQLKGYAFFLSDVKGVLVEGGVVKIKLEESTRNRFLEAVGDGEKNAVAGAVLAGESLRNKAHASSSKNVVGSDTDYGRAIRGLIAMEETPGHPGLERSLAAMAGASISTLGPAVTEDVHRQLNAIRNRMTTMANEVTEETHDKLPLWHAWINAEGNYHKLDADSLAPGYTLNSWGGTVGVDADVSPHITVGLAISAMYGDLKTDAADSATGSVDTTYLSAFLRAAKGSWVHSFVVTCGIAEVDLDRTVNYGSGSYSTNGSTDGYTFGAMYEVGYTGFVNKRGTAALQPVANVEVRHISLKGYSETGSDAGLTVDDMERTVLTFGVGARAQVAVGANAFNRTSVLESRALLKFDVGDRSGTARNAIIGDSTHAETESAEVGAVGVEVGVGISVPLGAQSGSVFADGSLEFRDGWTSANATLGYRVTF